MNSSRWSSLSICGVFSWTTPGLSPCSTKILIILPANEVWSARRSLEGYGCVWWTDQVTAWPAICWSGVKSAVVLECAVTSILCWNESEYLIIIIQINYSCIIQGSKQWLVTSQCPAQITVSLANHRSWLVMIGSPVILVRTKMSKTYSHVLKKCFLLSYSQLSMFVKLG